MRVIFLIGSDSAATRASIEAVCRTTDIEPVAVLLDTANVAAKRRVSNLRRNIRREGMGYAGHRFLTAVAQKLDSWAERIIPQDQVLALLRTAFPQRCFSLADLGTRYGFPIIAAGNLNSPEAVEVLREQKPDLGIVLGTRILRRSTFSVPAMGCINLHKGKVPEFRGMPPAFWELYEGAASAGVTVHFVDSGLDTGDIVGAAEVAIHPNETETSLRTKLDLEGARLLAECAGQLAAGTAKRTPQPSSSLKPRNLPSRADRQELARRRPQAVSQANLLKHAIKTAVHLSLYHFGVFSWFNKRHKQGSRGAILLYHRVNDFSIDPLTTSTESFAKHLILLRTHYRLSGTTELMDALRQGQAPPSGAVAIHFDDCYRDVFQLALPLLRAADAHATSFISSGFVGTDRSFQHDLKRYPFHYENLYAEEIRELKAGGVDIGAHTINHVNLGETPLDVAREEILGSRRDLEQLLGEPVPFFSFPFGKMNNIREDVREVIRQAKFTALFSAYGGFINQSTSLFDVPRMGVSSAQRPIDLMMELEGIAMRDLLRAVNIFRFRNRNWTPTA